MTSFGIHDCKKISVQQHQPENANAIVMRIWHEAHGYTLDGYGEVECHSDVTLYGLPTEVTDILLEHFGNPNEEEEAA